MKLLKLYMKASLINVTLLFVLFSYSGKGCAQSIPIKRRFENILIKKDTSFVKHISISLEKSKEPLVYPIFYDSELEEVSDIQVYIKKGRRFKPMDSHVSEEDIELDYITSSKVKSVVIPPDSEAKITYSVTCSELMYFSSLRFFSNNPIDSLQYRISVPNKFNFVHNTIYRDSLPHFAMDSIRTDSLTTWNIKVVPVKVEPNLLQYFGIYKDMKVPLMRTVIIPSNYVNREKDYMNEWYLNKVDKTRGLDPEVLQKIDEITQGIIDSEKIVETLYSYIRTNFKYVAIEIGMGAFIPTHVNEVYINKQGDCKDLSNFLSEALNYKGIKSEIALAATYNHISDCDFPALSSANHVICLAYINDKPILLDPTDPIHILETPIQSIQNRSILIINSSGGEYYKVNTFSPEQNLIQYQIDIETITDQLLMRGDFKVDYAGISGNFLKYAFLYESKKDINIYGLRHYESVFGNQSVTKLDINNLKSLEANGQLSVDGKIFKDGVNRLLFIDFIPRLFEVENRETLLEGTHLGTPVSKKVNLNIKLDESVEKFQPIEHHFSNQGVSLRMKITNPSENIIQCQYEFISDFILVEKENVDSINEVLKSFKKIINEPIIYKKKTL